MAINDIRMKWANPSNAAEMRAFIRNTNMALRRLQGMTTDLGPEDVFGDMSTQPRVGAQIATPTVTGGSVDSATIGGSTPAAGTFTDLKATSKFGLGVLASQQAGIADATTAHAITDPSDSPADADALRDDLVANAIPQIEAALDAIGGKVNAIITVLEAFGLTVTV